MALPFVEEGAIPDCCGEWSEIPGSACEAHLESSGSPDFDLGYDCTRIRGHSGPHIACFYHPEGEWATHRLATWFDSPPYVVSVSLV